MMAQVSASNTPDAQENRRSEDLDEKDLKLISLLRRNARAPIVALARHIGLSRSATQDRMARLEGSGAIAGYRVVEGTPGTIVQAAHLLARFESGKTCDQIAPRVKAIPFVTRIDSLAGEIDLLVSVDADSIDSVEDVRRQVASVPDIATVTTALVLRRHL
ncbi:AsnC family transcriptional regulator [Sinorhizobium meliloti]|uniref:Lrp/AsnC family transcriptional regulator n=1 Tax=Rhizobium meliloti TaxID=382 RepID=UPI001295F62C|nr:Lrp/AsnC family transcriptional regulator [Sinorhizobium meliloti]MDX0371555.1 AsnC family transcriptional regulator [Sinorhizobium meliloti]MQV32653.1 AsnC family transcriptional regulator [Sinorhizobium meliloti]